ncbi:rhodanese-like domain-containing protein [Roseomonas sp. CCTCC AB2023176]|uniref:rhodanese-like domain-containing protein n=1 Tax=Roseomonas sp. CCTCC AB2023176 TaxID=3342640 RepID=UPI0035E0047E
MPQTFLFDPGTAGATLFLCEGAIHLFLTGVPEITAPALAARLDRPGRPIVLDVRAPEEHAVSRIPGARLVLPDTPPAALLPELGTEDRLVVLACSVGLRSGRLARDLIAAGLPARRVANLRGGLFRWSRLGLPMEDDRGPTTAVHPYDARWGRLLLG